MNQLAHIAEPRTVPFASTVFRAFRVSEGFDGRRDTPLNGRTSDLGIIEADTLDGALNETLASYGAYHKQHLVIQESGERGIRLHVFAIKKKSAPRWVYKDHVTRAVHDLYASPVCTIDGGVVG